MDVLITGANRGLGCALVRKAVELGYRIFAGVRDIEKVSTELTEMKGQYGERIELIQLDVTDENSVKNAFLEISKKTNSLDVIINNAGVLKDRDKGIENVDLKNVEEVLKVNLLGAMRVVKYFLFLLRKGSNKVIVNISSEAGSFANAYGGDYPYAISKAALNFFTAQLKNELWKDGIRVYAIHPGWMKTDMGGLSAPTSPYDSAEEIMKIIDGRTKVDERHFFINYLGQPMEL